MNSPTIFRFTVVSGGQFVTNLTKSNVRFALAQLVPAATLNTLTSAATSQPAWTTPYDAKGPDQWVNVKFNLAKSNGTASGPYTVASRCTTTPCDAQDWQATTESPTGSPTDAQCQGLTDATGVGTGCLVYDSTNHFYTFYAKTDPKTATLPGPLGAATTTLFWDSNAVHRVAIQLSYTDINSGSTVLVNPWYDFTLDASGNSVVVSDFTKDHIVVGVSSCNTCHSKLALHGGGRVDTHYCVLCHNGFTADPYTGNVLDLRTMVHQIHAGRKLTQGYTVVGYQNNVSNFSDVGFPQDLRNCTKCHTGDAAVAGRIDAATKGTDGTVAIHATPQGNNWQSETTKAACLTCHDDTLSSSPLHVLQSTGASNSWYGIHNPTGISTATSDQVCQNCHIAGTSLGADVVHWSQAIDDGRNYKYNLISASYDSGTRAVTVKYSITNPNNGNSPYDPTDARLAGVRLILGYYNLKSTSALPEFTNYNNSGSVTVNASAGVANGDGTYTATLALPADTATKVAAGGTAQVLMYGAVKEHQLSTSDHTTDLSGANTYNVVVHPEAIAFAISGTKTARRTVVADYKCDSCHGVLDSASGSNTLPIAFHSGDRGSVLACPICHDVNRLSSGELQNALSDFAINNPIAVTTGYNESFSFRRFVHGIHSAGAGFRGMPFLHGNANTTGEDYAESVSYPGELDNCTQCHMVPGDVGNTRNVYTYSQDDNPLGVAVNKYSSFTTGNAAWTNLNTGPTIADPMAWNVIAPQASACSACHDGIGAANHMINVGGATFGTQINATWPGNELGQVAAGGPANLLWDAANGTQMNVVGSFGSLQGTIFEACDGCHGNTSNGNNGIAPVNGIGGLRVLDVHKAQVFQFPSPGD